MTDTSHTLIQFCFFLHQYTLQNRNNLNISRKLTHAAFGLFFATLNQLVPKATFIPCMTILTSLTLLMEKVRYKQGFGWINDALHFFLGQSLRKHEMEGKFTGSFYYFLGVTLTSYLFPTPCASLGIVQLALADPAASYFGRLTKNVSWSRIQQGFYGMGRNKGLLGFLLGAIFCVPFNYRILSLAATASSSSSSLSRTLPPLQMGFLSLFLGLAGAFADLLVPSPALIIPLGPAPHFHVDDNFVVPLFAGYACTQVFRMIGWTDIHLAPWLFL
jgi:dolichol kinase